LCQLTFAHFRRRDAFDFFCPALVDCERNGILGKFPPQLLFQLLNDRVTLLRSFGKPFQYLIADALNLKTMFGQLNPVADLLHPLRQFVPIDRRAVTDGVIHAARLQGFPGPFAVIKRGVEHREMGVQLRVERATARVRERRGGEIAGDPVFLIALLTDSGSSESFKFAERNARGLLVRRQQPFIRQRHRQHRNRFRCRAGEIIKHPPLTLLQLPLRQALAGFRILIFAQRMKLFARDFAL